MTRPTVTDRRLHPAPGGGRLGRQCQLEHEDDQELGQLLHRRTDVASVHAAGTRFHGHRGRVVLGAAGSDQPELPRTAGVLPAGHPLLGILFCTRGSTSSANGFPIPVVDVAVRCARTPTRRVTSGAPSTRLRVTGYGAECVEGLFA